MLILKRIVRACIHGPAQGLFLSLLMIVAVSIGASARSGQFSSPTAGNFDRSLGGPGLIASAGGPVAGSIDGAPVVPVPEPGDGVGPPDGAGVPPDGAGGGRGDVPDAPGADPGAAPGETPDDVVVSDGSGGVRPDRPDRPDRPGQPATPGAQAGDHGADDDRPDRPGGAEDRTSTPGSADGADGHAGGTGQGTRPGV